MAAQKLGIKAKIVMPLPSPAIKVYYFPDLSKIQTDA